MSVVCRAQLQSRMASLASRKLQKTVSAKWRHASTAFFRSHTLHKQCEPVVEFLRTSKEGEFSSLAVADVVGGAEFPAVCPTSSSTGKKVKAKLVVLRRKEHQLEDKLIPKSVWNVLHRLHELGFDTYLVGGSIRDLLLKQVPKDYDVLSTAKLNEVKAGFRNRTLIIGRRFPICHVISRGSVVEVSSFSTTLRTFGRNRGAKSVVDQDSLSGVDDWDETDFVRWENSQKRDFTVNGLFYDPFKGVLYDYVGGLEDLKKLKIRTVMSANDSFAEDPARMLRAFRFAARLRFSLARETGRAIENQKYSICELNVARLALEVNTLMAYGSAERSIRLLWRYHVLELIFPLQAKYFMAQNFKRKVPGASLLLDFLANMDRVLAPDRPCHTSLWVLVLAFHLALAEEKRNHITVAAVALAMYHRTGLHEGEKKARRISKKYREKGNTCVGDSVANELLVTDAASDTEFLVEDGLDLVRKVISCLKRMTNKNGSLGSGMQHMQEFIPKAVYLKVLCIVERAKDNLKAGGSGCPKKKRGNIKDDAERIKAVAEGNTEEVSFVFSRIVLNTLFPAHVGD